MEKIKRIVDMMLKPLRNRVYGMITRAVVESVKDDQGMQLVKLNLLAGVDESDVERFQNFGFTSNPPANSEAVALAVGGNPDHLIVVAVDDRATRVKDLGEGESAMFNANSDFIKLLMSGKMQGELSDNLELKLKKIKFENDANELIDLIVQLADEVAKGTTNTVFGPLRKNNHVAIQEIKTKLETFKV